MLDLKIMNGMVVDGSGSAAVRADVGIKDGRIVAIGAVDRPAREEIDAAGRVVAPGFIDVHTHYDAQAFWDPTFSPSCYHGVTTVFGGFCGFSIAPLSAESAGYLMPMLARVEGMPLTLLQSAVPWNWSSFGDYLDRLEGGIGLNAGFFAGHSAIRRHVMGPRAVGEKADAEEVEAMKTLLDRSLAEGAMGFSTTVSATHNDGDGNPVPSRWAEPSELIALAGVVRDHEGTGLELLPDVDFGPDMIELIADLSIAGNRPINWNVLMVTGRADAEKIADHQLSVSSKARERGGEVIALTVPYTPNVYMNLRTGFVFDALPGVWRDIFKLPIEARMERFRDPETRAAMARDAASVPRGASREITANLAGYMVTAVDTPANKPFEGRRIGEIAAELGKAPIDVMLDIALDDRLETILTPDFGGEDEASYRLRGRIWADDRTLIGASDAGAHLDLIDTFAFSTKLLQRGVRDFGVIGLEAAVHQITGRAAAYFGLVERGLIAAGYHADIVVFDPATVGCGPTYSRYDLPGGGDSEFRLYADAEGIDHVLVNGVEVVRRGSHTGKLPGAVLRSGKDTRTVALDALRAA